MDVNSLSVSRLNHISKSIQGDNALIYISHWHCAGGLSKASHNTDQTPIIMQLPLYPGVSYMHIRQIHISQYSRGFWQICYCVILDMPNRISLVHHGFPPMYNIQYCIVLSIFIYSQLSSSTLHILCVWYIQIIIQCKTKWVLWKTFFMYNASTQFYSLCYMACTAHTITFCWICCPILCDFFCN